MPFEAVAAALTGIAVIVFYLSSVAVRAPSAAARRLKEGERAALAGVGLPLPVSPQERVAALRRRAADTLAQMGRGMKRPDGLARRLKWAGITLSPEAWQAVPYPLAGIGAVVGVLAGEAVHHSVLLLLLVGGVVGAMAPSFVLTGRLGTRKARIAREILTYTEYLAMAMKAGADFRTAIEQVEERFPGPVSEAFTGALLSSGIGARMDDGLRRVQEELNSPDADAVVDTLTKNLQYGARCADVLVEIVRGIRKERVERVMEKAGRAAMLMLLPAVLFDLPVVFAVVVFPMLHEAIGFLHP